MDIHWNKKEDARISLVTSASRMFNSLENSAPLRSFDILAPYKLAYYYYYYEEHPC